MSGADGSTGFFVFLADFLLALFLVVIMLSPSMFRRQYCEEQQKARLIPSNR